MTASAGDKTEGESSKPLGNPGKPIALTGVDIRGVAAENAQQQGKIKIWTRLAITSDEKIFHYISENLSSLVNKYLHNAGESARIDRAHTVLLVIRPDNSGELWIDAAAVSLRALAKRDMAAGTAVYENDIADITGMSFPYVNIDKSDRVICIFRQDWRFALFFDFNPDSNLDVENVITTLGSLYRHMRYFHLYDIVSNNDKFERLIQNGWFPFAEIVGPEFKELAKFIDAGFSLNEAEEKIVSNFDEQRLQRILDRWLRIPHFSSRKSLLTAAINAFERREPIATIKIILTEIEGILQDSYFNTNGTKERRVEKLLEFAILSAEKKTGSPNTLLLSSAFAKYLKEYTFAQFDPTASTGTAGSRHAVSHGAAQPATYTQVRALQAVLTLDQLALFA